MSKTIHIGLLWHSASSGNLGIGALTLADLDIARKILAEQGLEGRFTLISMRDGDTAPITPPEVDVFKLDSRTLISPSGYWRKVKEFDCILDIGAGDSFAEIYGWKRFAFMWLTKYMALKRKVPLILSPQTIGPFTKTPYKQLAAHVMNQCVAVISRDDKSLEVARQMAPRANNMLSVDVAFVLPYQSRSGETGGKPIKVGLNVSGLLYHEAETGRNRFGLSYSYARFTDMLIERLLARGDVEVHLVPHATSKGDPTDDDGRRADILAQRFPGVIRVPDFAGPSEAKSYISGLDLLIAGRMHACIGAYSSVTPVLLVSYSRKFSGLFGMLGYEHMVPVTGETEETAVEMALATLEKRQELKGEIEQGMRQVQSRLDIYRDALRALFADMKARVA
ncbi:MAG: polysaccharide pyruvyl transferase family protein [Sphingobium sp.]|nr:polysaccharide pyruvyl transferase family protein [Sphingobium sp.]MCP5397800.1 polysaccharide pyruvyl transferase family protein [Sphingomonas sp.]